MAAGFSYPRFPFQPPPELATGHGTAEVVIVGGGVVGLTTALDLALHGVRTVLLDDDDTVSVGSRAICWSKRTLEIYDRLGLGAAMVEKGVTWKLGKVFLGDRLAYAFDLLPEAGHKMPAFVNLQQYHLESWLVEACRASGRVDLRWRSRVEAVAPGPDGVALEVATPAGRYRLETAWCLACDGARSTVRERLGLAFEGRTFRDRFLIADVRISGLELPAERRFWFDPPFHPGQSVLLHKQPDGLWRVDFQLGPDADPEAEKEPERVLARIRTMLGPAVGLELDWVSVYTFRCRRLARFRHGRVFLLGDAAHQVSPFGARGGNGGVQDADNLVWKLAAVLQGRASETLLDSYDAERIPAADENILHSTRATDFISPKTAAARAYRDAVLLLAGEAACARAMVNAGRLSTPHSYRASPLSTPDAEPWPGGPEPGAPLPDLPWPEGGFLLERTGGRPLLLRFGSGPPLAVAGLEELRLPADRLAAERLGVGDGSAILLRPDQHVAARFRRPEPAAVAAALDRLWGRPAPALRRAG